MKITHTLITPANTKPRQITRTLNKSVEANQSTSKVTGPKKISTPAQKPTQNQTQTQITPISKSKSNPKPTPTTTTLTTNKTRIPTETTIILMLDSMMIYHMIKSYLMIIKNDLILLSKMVRDRKDKKILGVI